MNNWNEEFIVYTMEPTFENNNVGRYLTTYLT